MIILLLSLILFATSTVESASPKNKTSRHQHQHRITNGYDTEIKDANYYVYFTCNAACGGTIVSLTKVITAAHCTLDCDPKNIQLFMGKNSWSEQGERYLADNLFRHPKYNPNEGFQYDIAVVYVSGEIRPNSNVDRTHYSLSYPPINDYVMCLGYGGIAGGGPPQKLQRTWNLIKSYDKNLMIVDSEQTGVQPGDSGGPCMYNNQLAGVIVGYVTGQIDVEVNIASPEILEFIRSHGL